MVGPEVFINYRTGDGEEAAELIARHLSARFGAEHVFKAPRSIRPGEAFPQALVNGSGGCLVLLAIIGPGWSHAQQLSDPDDWVRREILTAYDSGALVVPVLKGRKTDRLHIHDLPAELAWLAEVQSLLLDIHESSADLNKIVDFLADQVPRLMTIDRADGPPSAAPTNSAGGPQGPVAQTGTVSGNVNVFGSTHGPVHTGKGDIYQDPRPRREEAGQ